MKQPVLLAVLALTSLAMAQNGPVCEPMDADQTTPVAAMTAAMPGARRIDPSTQGARVAGKELKLAVKKVAALRWHEDPVEARAESAATGKPMLWIYALGELDGFA